ncbi:complement C3-like [Leptodactylus fuscus]|uniref:complement C3-like n=1 Tax=Leptodactylus fuscus TaxID=238119 RepID=UPI003F4EA8E9
MMGRVVLYITLLTCLTAVYGEPPCALIMPNVLHVEVEETIVVDAHLQKEDFKAEIIIQDFPLKELEVAKTMVNLNSANGFLEKVTMKISATKFKQEPLRKKYVSVSVRSDKCNLIKVVLLSFHTGYIFIQTDKPIYNPGTAVLYRAYVTSLSLQPDSRTVDMEVTNPDGIVVLKSLLSSNKESVIIHKSYTLPEIATEGIWKITSHFQEAPQEIFQTEFEVKEYVLPSFEVLLETPQSYYFVDDDHFTVDITARFLHGKAVEGSGNVMFGVSVNKEKRSLPDSIKNITVIDGKAKATLHRHMISSIFWDVESLVGSSLYVTVTVLTNAGSDLVTAERIDIPIVKTAFKMLFPKTSKYFKPGLPYIANILLQSPDGSIAPNVEICTVDNKCITTDKRGEAQLVLNTQSDIQEMEIHLGTKALDVSATRQTFAKLKVKAYKPRHGPGNYLHIGVLSTKVNPGDTLHIHFVVKTKNMNIQRSFSFITYMILSKGQIIKIGQQPRDPEQTLTVMSLVISDKYMPSFRIVAYYTVPGNEIEIVSDSVWVDVVNSCIQKLDFSPDRAVMDPQPGSVVRMRITGEPGASVGLVAVDKAVFVLNKKNILSQDKIWQEVEKSDLGCTPGGGIDNAGVFTDAGLSVETNIGLTNSIRLELTCEEPSRRKRSVSSEAKAKKAQEYIDLRLRRCCEDGMRENPMGYSCQKRSEFVLEDGECATVFLACCKFVFEPETAIRRKPGRRPTMNYMHHASVVKESIQSGTSADDDSYEMMENINVRSIFYESWLWKVEVLPTRADSNGLSSKVINANLPESITTWEFLAISLSPKSGICVAKPYEMLVKKSFFIDLRLPYSVVRNEQVEIQAVLYSYVEEEIEVRVELTHNAKMCSSATAEANFRQVVTLAKMASWVIPFVIVPLEIGNIRIEVKASVKDWYLTDGVVKHLKVVPEGMKILKTIQSVILEPLRSGADNGIQEIILNTFPPNDIVPNTDPETYVSVKGGLLGETLDNSIDGAKLKHLIVVPSGCGEQIMMSMTPTVIACRYLDVTNQWEKIGMERREEAVKNINQGYIQQLVFRKPDNSYSAFTNRPASTWLTAYVVKVFSLAYKFIPIDKNILCGAITWLLKEKQEANGVFREDAPVIHGEMVGGTGNTETDASLTAFVLIALVEAKSYCQDKVPELESGVSKSAAYLEGRMKTLKKRYSTCITSYALSLVDRLPNADVLLRTSTDGTHWDDYSSELYMIEATSYGLLALLKLGNYASARPVAQWLIEQRFYGGGYGSTQATIMVFQAMSEYQIHAPEINEVDMDVRLSLPGRSGGLTWKINTQNIMLQRSEKMAMKGGELKVTATGKGTGTLTVMSVYYTPLAEGTVPCKKFEFSVKLEDLPKGAKKPIGVMKSMFVNIYMKYLGPSDSTMTIVDLSLLTGFTPDTDDLNRLTNHVDKYISKYEMDTERSERGSLILYLDKVSNTETQHLKFRIHQNFEVGILQPAAITIYEYYALENRCTKFYHPTEEEGELRKICKDAECHCISERCTLKNAYKGKLDPNKRIELACAPGVDYVYECKLENIEKTGAYDIFTMVVTRVVKLGTDEIKDGDKRRFYIHKSCRDSVKVNVGRTYIMWGRSEDVWEMKNEMSYVINGGTWLETVPTKRECATSDLCEDIYNFIDHLRLTGCPH